MNETREQAIVRIAADVQTLNQCSWSEAIQIATTIYDKEMS